MGKITASSWLETVKRAFRSPAKERNNGRRREEHEQDAEEEKKRGKRRWIFKKSCPQETIIQHNEAKNAPHATSSSGEHAGELEQERAMALAMATTVAAEAVIATAQAAVEIIRLSRPSFSVRKHYAAVYIQTAFRGYLARRALQALRGVVKLQALVRGHNVRERAKMTLQCMQSLVRVQARVCDQRKKLSCQGSLNSASSDSSTESGSQLADQKSVSRDDQSRSSITEECEKDLTLAFIHQMWRSGRNRYPDMEEEEEEGVVFEGNMRYDKVRRYSYDPRGENIKTVEIDTAQPYSSAPNCHCQQPKHNSLYLVTSPLHRTHQNPSSQSPITPSPSRILKPTQVQSASPRCRTEEIQSNYLVSHTPNIRYTYSHGTPNYMAATASAMARARSESVPRQRCDREKKGSVKKRLSFNTPDQTSCNGGAGYSDSEIDRNLRNPIHMAINGGHPVGSNRRLSMYSCSKDRVEEENYRSSFSEGRRWSSNLFRGNEWACQGGNYNDA